MKKDGLKKSLFKRVERYNIDEKILNKIFKRVYKENLEETIINKSFDIETEKYMIDQIKKGEVRYQEEITKANSFLKIMFEKDKIHFVDKESTEKIYEEAIEVAIEEYNDKQTFNILILKYMKKLSAHYKYNYDKKLPSVKTTTKKDEKTMETKKEVVKNLGNENLSKQIVENDDTSINESIKEKEIVIVKTQKISIEENDRLVSLITKYIKAINISKKEFTDKVKISYPSFISYITKTTKFQNSTVEKVLSYFEAKNLNELEEKINQKIEEYNKQHENQIKNDQIVLLLKKYIKGIKITQKEMASRINITEAMLGFYLLRKVKIQDYVIENIYRYFEIKSLNELEEKINIKIKEYNEKQNQELTNNDIMELLICYISETRIEQNTLARKIGINKDSFANYIYERNGISDISMKKILKYFDVKTTKQLQEKIEKDIDENRKKYNLSDDELIILIKEYINSKDISQRNLAAELNINECVFNQYLRKDKKFKKENIDKILDYFNVETMGELKDVIEKITKKYLQENKSNNDEINTQQEVEILNDNKPLVKDNIKKFDKDNESIKDEVKMQQKMQKINIKQNVPIIQKNDILNLVNIDILNSLLDDSLKNDLISKEEYIISWLLFGRNNGIYYSKEKIAEFLDKDVEYISKIYINCLIMYRNYFNDKLKNISELKLINED